MVIALDELVAYRNDQSLARRLMKSPLRARLVRLWSVIAISLLMLVLSAAVWGAVYLLNSYLLNSARLQSRVHHAATHDVHGHGHQPERPESLARSK
jgi:hypothetical protein